MASKALVGLPPVKTATGANTEEATMQTSIMAIVDQMVEIKVKYRLDAIKMAMEKAL